MTITTMDPIVPTTEHLSLSAEQEKQLKKALSKDIFDTLTEDDKKDFAGQIEQIEKDLEHKNTIKVKVRPGVIKLLCKIAGVHDIKAGAYRGDTIYVGRNADLFNPQLLQHESIHIDQQVEINKNKILGFLKRTLKTLKDMSEYKKTHGNSKYVKYESSTLTPMELEAYTHQDDKDYLKTRESFAYKKYETLEGEQQAFKKIGARNDEYIRNKLESKNPVAKNITHDIDKLHQVINETKDTDRTMRVFNAVDDVNELSSVLPLLKKKLHLIQKSPNLVSFEDNKKQEKYSEAYWNDVDELNKLKNEYDREINKYNATSLLDDDFNDEEAIIKGMERLTEQLNAFKKEPTRFRLESKKTKEDNIQIEIPPK